MPRGDRKVFRGRPRKEILPATPAEKVGRPRSVINHEQFEELCKIQCTLIEMAAVLGCSQQAVIDFCRAKYDKTFQEAFDLFSSSGKASVRRNLFEKAISKDKDSLGSIIWFSKQYMGQSEKVTTTNTNINEDNVKVDLLVDTLVNLIGNKSEKLVNGQSEVKAIDSGKDQGTVSDTNTTSVAESIADSLSKKPV